MKKKILLTRPQLASAHWAGLLARRGFDSLIDPLLTVEAALSPFPQDSFQASLITSANAFAAADKLKSPLAGLAALPCFCVGASTGDAARQFGFQDIRCGASDSSAVAQMIVSALADKNRPVLHIAGEAADGKARQILAQNGFTLTGWTVYTAHAAENFAPATQAAFKAGEIAAIPVFSPRSARILVSLIERNGLVPFCSGIVAIGLSQAVADVLQILPWRRLRVAATPLEEEVLACLEEEFP